jgi:hypothetical protein
MGTWGVLAFDNDDANDWAYGLDEVNDLSLVESTFATVEGADDYLEAPDASNALAACEVIVRLNGHSGYTNAYTEKVDEWVKRNKQTPSPELITRGNAVIDRVLGANSELRELWSESEASEWLESVEDLRRRLRA